MNSSSPEASLARRWERVARSYLRPPPAGGFTVAVAGPDDAGKVARLASALRQCTKDLGLLGGEERAGVEVVDLGMVDEERLGLLALEEPFPIDLLVWSAPEAAPGGLRARYLLGVFAWAKAPGDLVCLLPPGMGMEARRKALEGLDLAVPREFHCLRGESALFAEDLSTPGAEGSSAQGEFSAGDSTLMAGILQAALARADARGRQQSF